MDLLTVLCGEIVHLRTGLAHSLCTVLNKIMEYSGNVVVNLKKMIEFLRFPVIFLL